MPFVDDLIKHTSVSIIGTEKNTGKTECLKHILRRLDGSGHRLAVTSIGLDGEGIDQVTLTPKPEIFLSEGTIFVTTEAHFRTKKLDAEILDVSQQRTSLGRLITARVKGRGKVLLSGPSDTIWLKKLIDQMQLYQIDTTLVDGALSRQSPGSPAITQAMILTTGAALSANINTLVSKTAFLYELIQLPLWDNPLSEKMLQQTHGVWAVDEYGQMHELPFQSAFTLDANKEELFQHGHTIYASGAITSRLLNTLRMQPNIGKTRLIARDFSKIFADHQSYQAFTKNGGQINVLLQTKLIALCVNPVSPKGYILDSVKLREQMQATLQIPVYDLFNL